LAIVACHWASSCWALLRLAWTSCWICVRAAFTSASDAERACSTCCALCSV